jgi:hypothetical protein
MPALFAYVIAIGLLLGGGYGTLSWLAAPEPVKVAARIKAKPPQRVDAAAETALAVTSPNQTDNTDKTAFDSGKTVSASTEQPSSAAAPVAASQIPPVGDSSAATRQQIRSAHAEAPVEQQPPAQPAVALPSVAVTPPPRAAVKLAASASSATAAKTVRRPHVRQASRQPERPAEKRRLALMILRTIQYPDGRRVSQLLPYRGGGRALAFVPDE